MNAQLTPASPARSIFEMGRRRAKELELPKHVHRVLARGRVYWYWQQGRGRPKEQRGERHPIHGDPYAPAGSVPHTTFWSEVARLATANVVYPVGTLGDLVARYRADDAYTSLAPATKRTYDVTLNRFVKPDTWGMIPINDLTPLAVAAGRDTLATTPVLANQMLAVGRGLYHWATGHGLSTIANPFAAIRSLKIRDDRGHIPWPAWAVAYVLQHAPEDLARMVRLGIASCQRESDLVRLGPQHRAAGASVGQGIWCRPLKTPRRGRRAVFIPLALTDALELDRWKKSAISFTATRTKPVVQHRQDIYLYSPRGAPYTPTSLRARWGRWLASEAGKDLCRRWREWLAHMAARYDWNMDPDDKRGPTIHGLRGTGFLVRFAVGYSVDQIANDVGATAQTVAAYMRYRDQLEVAAAGRERLRLVDWKEG